MLFGCYLKHAESNPISLQLFRVIISGEFININHGKVI